ncbi:MAG: glycosyltransferase family 39 protein [Flavobacteriales bacterium]|nr:glycosyltransferase family 39 protein [Flavobacteriales bacterium]
MNFKNIHSIFWLITCSVFLILTVPVLLQDGMFLDGVTYSAVSKNLAMGIGEFWKPHYTQTLYPAFYEHPPLGLWIQSVFFQVLGNSMYTERIYSLVTGMLIALGIFMNWRLFTFKTDYRKLAWFPVLLWTLTPLAFDAVRRNLLENTMAVFCLFSIYFICKSLRTKNIIPGLIGSALILGAFLTKGLVGLFPMAVVFIYWVALKEIKLTQAIAYSIIAVLTPPVLFYIISFFSKGALDNLIGYFNNQIFQTFVENNDHTTTNRFAIIGSLLEQLIISMVIVALIVAWKKKKDLPMEFPLGRLSVFFILIGLSASLPITLSLKQRLYYLLPSLSFFALGFSCLIVPVLSNFLNKVKPSFQSRLKIVAIVLAVATIVVSSLSIGKVGRDKDDLHDVAVLSDFFPEGTVISTTSDLCFNWGLVAYLARVGYISLDCNVGHDYYLIRNWEKLKEPMEKEYQLVDLDLTSYKLYRMN